MTALSYAIECEYEDLVVQLIAAGATVDAPEDNDGETPLSRAEEIPSMVDLLKSLCSSDGGDSSKVV